MATTNRQAYDFLAELGFGDYEIKAYLGLLSNGRMNGYQLAKVSGIPRPNIYSVLERLHERGAIDSMNTGGTVEYQALPAEDMLNRLTRSFQSNVTGAKTALQNVSSQIEPPLAWNMKGHATLLASVEKVIEGASSDLFIALWPQEAASLTGAIARALKRGVKPTVLCLYGCDHECGSCAGHIYRYPIDAKDGNRSIIVTADQRTMTVGDLSVDGTAMGAHSHSGVMVKVATQYILNAIAVSEIVRSLGPKLLKVVDARAMDALKGAGLSANHQPWFERIFSSVHPREEKK